MTEFTHEDHRPAALPSSRTGWNGPAHQRFGDIAANYASRATGGFGEATGLVRDAQMEVANVSRMCGDAVRQSASTAVDKRIAPEGRAEAVSGINQKLGEDGTARLDRAENLMLMARAELEMKAMRTVSRAEENTARQDAMMMLQNVKPSELTGRMLELARRDDSVGALIASDWGRDYMASRGVRTDTHDGIRAAALQAAADSGDETRRAAATALGKLEHVNGAIFAARRQLAHARQTDIASIAATIKNPLAVENDRLRSIIASQRPSQRAS